MLCFYAHHRCASSWCNDILRRIAIEAGWRHRVAHNDEDLGDGVANYVARERPDILTFSNARLEYAAELAAYPGLHLIRDPRDVLVSSYFAHRYSHPTERWPALLEHRRELQELTKEQGLLLELDCRAEQFAAMAEWNYAQANIMECRVESFVPAAASRFSAFFSSAEKLENGASSLFWPLASAYNRLQAHGHRHGLRGLPAWRSSRVPASVSASAVARNAFDRKTGGREPGDSDPYHHYRSGVSGGWQQHFTPELRERFKARYNNLLVTLGYETSADW